MFGRRNHWSTKNVSGNAAWQQTSTKKLPKNLPRRYEARPTGLEKISGVTPARKSLTTGSPMRTAVKNGSVMKEKTGIMPAMKLSLLTASPLLSAGPQPHHSRALPPNSSAIA
jgi:hypothetical protein